MSRSAGAYALRFGWSKSHPTVLLKEARGPVEIGKTRFSGSRHSRGFTEYHMKVGGVKFILDDELVGVINRGDSWSFYYVDFQDGSEGLILSAAPA